MQTTIISKMFILLAVLLTASADVLADPSGVDFGRTTYIAITATSSFNPTVIRSVTVRCPDNGYIQAVATIPLLIRKNDYNGARVLIRTSLAKNGTYDFSYENNVEEFFEGFSNYSSSNLTRTDSCSANEFVTYRISAYLTFGAANNSFAHDAVLSATFHKRRL